MEHFLGVAREQKITDEEIGVLLGIATAVSGGRVRAQFREVARRKKKKRK